MKVVVWNMAQKPTNWYELRALDGTDPADIALVSEAVPPPFDANALGRWVTRGLDADLPADKPVVRDWSTAIAASGPIVEIRDARVDRYYRDHLPFRASREGSWIAATVYVEGAAVTAIS